MVRTTPFLAAMFLVSALSLAGIPPLSGFVSKFALIDAGIADDQFAVVAVALVVSLLTLFSMIQDLDRRVLEPARGRAPAPAGIARARAAGPILMVLPTAALVACSLAIAAAAGPIYSLSERTARRSPRPRRLHRRGAEPMRPIGRVALLTGAVAPGLGRDQRGQHPQRRGRRGGASRRLSPVDVTICACPSQRRSPWRGWPVTSRSSS